MSVLKEKQNKLKESRLKQVQINEKIDETNAELELKEARDKRRKVEIKNLIENRKLREFELEQQKLREEMDIPDPDDYKSHNSSDDERASRSPSKMEKGSVAETPKSNQAGKKSAMSNKIPKEGDDDKKDDEKDKLKVDEKKKVTKKDSKAIVEEKETKEADSEKKAFT